MVSATIQGLTSGIIVALAIMVGISTASGDMVAVISSIVVIAFVEGFSDAFSEYLARRTDSSRKTREVWKDAFIVFTTKALIIMQFITPFIFLPLDEATQFAIFWGLFILSIVSGYIARQQIKRNIIRTMVIYVTAAIIIIAITYFIGDLVAYIFSLIPGF